MSQTHSVENYDPAEVRKFEELASRWWDPHSEFKPLHDINPLRLDYIDRLAPLAGKRVIDVVEEDIGRHGDVQRAAPSARMVVHQ